MTINYAQYEKLSPFEVNPELLRLASSVQGRPVLNAGRGNPNFLATVPRAAFFQLGQFAVQEADLSFSYLDAGVGGPTPAAGLVERFLRYLSDHEGEEGVFFLGRAVSYVRDQLGLSFEDFLHEITNGILGCYYPQPPRMQPFAEKIVGEYVLRAVGGGTLSTRTTDFFATEGGTAAMAYIFHSLKQNFLLKKGDKIALGLPIFSPYIEIPKLDDYDYEEISINADPALGWQYPEKELEKLKDPAIKVFFCVNPSNPPSVRMNDESLKKIADIVKNDRPDLIILADDVYSTFVDDFRSLYAVCPHNTILVYSFSKYFGSTGWRLGVIGMAKSNIVDQLLSKQPAAVKQTLAKRYSSLTSDSAALKFIDRLVADSRAVALNHTAGLSTPQQVQMLLFALFALVDLNHHYQDTLKKLLHRRESTLYREIGLPVPHDPLAADYYTLLELSALSEALHGKEFAEWMVTKHGGEELFFQLAQDAGIVVMPGKGFGALVPSARVSLANLSEYQYAAIGRGIRALMDKYYAAFKNGA